MSEQPKTIWEYVEKIRTASEEFCDRVRKARRAAGLSQDQASKAAGITQAYWSLIECGDVKPHAKFLKHRADIERCMRFGSCPTAKKEHQFNKAIKQVKRIASALGVTIEYLVDGTNKITKPTTQEREDV